jgi:uncharacterized protein (TIGR02145 family)
MGGDVMGVSQMLSVPYAKYADNAGNVEILMSDTSATNELQALSISNDTIYIESGGYVILPDSVSYANAAKIADTANNVLIQGDNGVPYRLHVDNLGNLYTESAIKCPSTLTDYDGNTYDVVKIGNQCWMSNNLRVRHYADGISINEVSDSANWSNLTASSKAYCWYNNDSASNAETYGALYTWAAAMNGSSSSTSNPSGIQGVCPDGWHLPSDAEWEELAEYISNDNGGYSTNVNGWFNVGGHLKATSGWGTGYNGTDDYGFSALPGGNRFGDGSFDYIGNYGHWWSATESGTDNAHFRYIGYDNDDFSEATDPKKGGVSVRCLRD